LYLSTMTSTFCPNNGGIVKRFDCNIADDHALLTAAIINGRFYGIFF
jgi:hypothetical protein